jgi:LysM repeat protein
MENAQSSLSQKNEGSAGMKILMAILWISSLIIAVFIGIALGQSGKPSGINAEKSLPLTTTNQITGIQTSNLQATPAIVNNNICKKSGFAQKWEYLTSYTVKANDTLQGIASSQLNDEARVNEIMQTNGVGPLIVGSTLYLPPPNITKSSGNIKQVHGRLVKKDDVNWQLSFNGDINGQGIIIPSFWFTEIPSEDSYKVGDCLTILFDDGYKVFSVSLQ